MAYSFDFLNEQKKKEQELLQNQGQPQQSSGGGTVVTGGNAPQGAPKGSGSFVNLQEYLTANQQQGKQFSDQTIGKVTSEAQQAKDQVQQNEQAFEQQVNQGAIRPDEQFVQNTISNAVDIFNNPDKQTERDRIQKTLTGQYQGPDNRDTLDDTKKAQGAQQKVDALQTEGGREGLLKEYYKRPDYTKGQVTLDNLLFGGAEGASQNFQQAKNQYGSIAEEANQSAIRSGEAVNKAKTDTSAAKQALQNAFNQAQQADVGSLQNYAQQYAAAKQKYQQQGLDLNDQVMRQVYEQAVANLAPRIQQRIYSGGTYADGRTYNAPANAEQLSQDYLQYVLGGTEQLDPNSQRNRLADSLFGTAANTQASNFATPEQRARLQALYGLSGGSNPLDLQAQGPDTNYDDIYNYIFRNRSIE